MNENENGLFVGIKSDKQNKVILKEFIKDKKCNAISLGAIGNGKKVNIKVKDFRQIKSTNVNLRSYCL